MASSLGTESKGSRNIELNIIPFIDLMSCITAFLLVAAVWVNIADLNVRPGGRGRDTLGEHEGVALSVLVDSDAVWIGVSRINEFEKIPRTADGYDWPRIEAALRVHKASSLFADEHSIEVAANSSRAHPVDYGAIVAAMDVAVQSGFTDVQLTDPNGLSAQPQL